MNRSNFNCRVNWGVYGADLSRLVRIAVKARVPGMMSIEDATRWRDSQSWGHLCKRITSTQRCWAFWRERLP